MPVEVLGLGGVPMAGDTLTVVENEARAREVAAYRQERGDASKRTVQAPVSLEGMFEALADKAKVIEYPVVIKGDVQGSRRGDRQRAEQSCRPTRSASACCCRAPVRSPRAT
jgi:translation initiation factor IF-2